MNTEEKNFAEAGPQAVSQSGTQPQIHSSSSPPSLPLYEQLVQAPRELPRDFLENSFQRLSISASNVPHQQSPSADNPRSRSSRLRSLLDEVKHHQSQRLLFQNNVANVGEASSNQMLNNGFLNGNSSDFPYFSRNRFRRQSNGGFGSDNYQISCEQCLKMIAEGSRERIDMIFNNKIDHICDMMVDPIGHQVIEKLMEKLGYDQITQIIDLVTHQYFRFVTICMNPLGTGSIQSLLKCLRSEDQIMRIVEAISKVATILTTSYNAKFVIMQCFKRFSPSQNNSLLEVIVGNFNRIATDQQGCRMLQECFGIRCDVLKQNLIIKIITNVLKLSANCYGNYLVQIVVGLRDRHVTYEIMRQLVGYYSYLSHDKFGSRVVQKLLEVIEIDTGFIMFDLMEDIDSLLVNQYGNYVIQTAWFMSKANVRNMLLFHIRRNAQLMRYNQYGRKILENLKLNL